MTECARGEEEDRERQRSRSTDRQTGRQTDRQAEKMKTRTHENQKYKVMRPCELDKGKEREQMEQGRQRWHRTKKKPSLRTKGEENWRQCPREGTGFVDYTGS